MAANAQQNLAMTKRLYDEVYNKLNINALDEAFATNATIFDDAVHNRKQNLREYKETENLYKRAFPNRKTKIDDIFATDDKVVVRWTVTGTHKGDLKDIATTNSNFKITGISVYHFTNGKITEVHQSWDRLGLLEQLGQVQEAEALH